MMIRRAAHMGMCFGVRDAIQMTLDMARGQSVTVLGQLAHNADVVAELRRGGVNMASREDELGSGSVVITAHGASDKRLARVRGRGLPVSEATCPLVRYAHDAVRCLADQGRFPVIVGKRGHVEVVGLTEDLEECAIVLTEEEVDRLPDRPKYGVAAQTTQPAARVAALVERLRRRFPSADVATIDTVCRPTKQRQDAAERLARECDVVIVVGGRNSNNTRELVETSRRCGARAHHVQGPSDICDAWFQSDDVVGLTAGTSTPDRVIDAVEAALRRMAERVSPDIFERAAELGRNSGG